MWETSAAFCSLIWLGTFLECKIRNMQSSILRTPAFSGVRPAVSSRRGAVSVHAVQQVKGIVVSTKMNRTVIVESERLATDPVYLKRNKVTKRYKAHDDSGTLNVGDVVRLDGTRPLSKTKRFVVAEVLRKAD